jgi:hypothetical protein
VDPAGHLPQRCVVSFCWPCHSFPVAVCLICAAWNKKGKVVVAGRPPLGCCSLHRERIITSVGAANSPNQMAGH